MLVRIPTSDRIAAPNGNWVWRHRTVTMSHLSLFLLGPFQATLDGEPVTHFESNKVRALLAYLVAERQRPHSRHVLAGLLWPDRPNSIALRNLRQALHNLRRAIRDRGASSPFLLVTRDTVQFNVRSDCWVDVAEFQRHIAASESTNPPGDAQAAHHLDRMKSAIALRRGPFLEGLSVRGSAPFEEWMLLKRESYDRQTSSLLQRMADLHQRRGEFAYASDIVRRRLELEPWHEAIHRQLMYLLALDGRRSAALAQYKTCQHILAEELGVEPSAETTALYQSIRDGMIPERFDFPVATQLTAAVPTCASTVATPPPFVAREHELSRLNGFLAEAHSGRGRVVFITGDAGSGKTALMNEFIQRAMAEHTDLLVTMGACSAIAGVGDPYLPFREILQLCTGDIEAKQATGHITTEHAERLWAAWPDVMRALVQAGPDLINRFVPGPALLARAETFTHDGLTGRPAWLQPLRRLARHSMSTPSPPTMQQTDLFAQFARVLQTLARHYPLLLAIDDLQWADSGSAGLLFHLGRRLKGHRILLVCTFRQSDLLSDATGRIHPLQSTVHELRRVFGDIEIDLNHAEGRRFIDEFLDSEPNRLGPGFRETLFRHTRGHALFTVELLHGLQERGDLVHDEAGRWVEGPSLNWEKLPARVEAVIAEQIRRLPRDWQAILTTASVEGEEFTAEVIAQVQEADEREIRQRLSGVLSRQHRLVNPHSRLRVGRRRLSRYQFRHYLFQKYLYRRLDHIERAHLHENIGNALETLYAEHTEEIALQLAHHFESAGLVDRAVDYLQQAGTRAVQMSAEAEAIALFTRALRLVADLPDTPERAEREMRLQIALTSPLMAMQGWGAPERARACERAYELCRQNGETAYLMEALFVQADICRAQAEHQKSLHLGTQLLELVQRAQDPTQNALAHWTLGETYFFLGELAPAREHLEKALSLYDPGQHHALTPITGISLGVVCLSWLSWVLWCLGYPQQALVVSGRAMQLAEDLNHPFSIGFAVALGVCGVHWLRREAGPIRDATDPLMHFINEDEAAGIRPWVLVFRGWALATRGELEEGIAQMREGLDNWKAMGAVSGISCQAIPLAEAYARAGRAAQGLALVDETLALVDRHRERLFEAELLRLKGDFLQQLGKPTEAETILRRAVNVAHHHRAITFELRSAISLCRLTERQGRGPEIRPVLRAAYDRFTEGFNTPDLREAQALLRAVEEPHEAYPHSPAAR